MSAYGAIQWSSRQGSSKPLLPTIWHIPTKNTPSSSHFITVHHLTFSTAVVVPGLLRALYKEYSDEVTRGMTFPQEPQEATQDAFEKYFFAADFFLGIVGASERLLCPGGSTVEMHDFEGVKAGNIDISMETARAGRAWEDCIAGFYFVKKYFLGRSSHICDCGIIIPQVHRSKGFGGLLTRSYLYYAPRLGYLASFTRVYATNHASLRIWESLNIPRAGLIPRAGRLLRADGHGEEYVDAWLFYKEFVTDRGGPEGEVARNLSKFVSKYGTDGVGRRQHGETTAEVSGSLAKL